MEPELDVSILGTLRMEVAGRRVDPGGPRQRAVVAALAIRPNTVVAAATIVDDVWGGDAPDRALHSLQQHLSEFRKVLAAPEVLVTREPGYLLVVSRLDADRFEELARAGADAASEGRHADALAHWDEAIGCWSGPVLADVAESPAIRATATRLHELRAVVQEDRVEALLSLGRERDAVVQLDSLVGEHPFRERLRGQQMLALYRSGRQSDALTAYRDAREVLVEGLGIEPSAELRELERLILEQSDLLDLGVGPAERVAAVSATFRDGGEHVARLELPDGQVVALVDGTVVVGRDPDSDVRLVDSRVSRRHAEIRTIDGEAMLIDLGSTNGTFLNGEPVSCAGLVDGDAVLIGGVELRFRVGR